MRKFKCVVVRSQYQTIIINAKNYTEAKENVRYMFDGDKEYQQYIEVYECNEVEPNKEKDNV
jgi:hypothetical protein